MTYPMPARRLMFILGSQGAGKTSLLKTLAYSAHAKVPEVTPLIVTNAPGEWGYKEAVHSSQFFAVSSFLRNWTPGQDGISQLLVILDNVDDKWPDAMGLFRSCIGKPFSLVATTLPNRWGNLQRQVFAADAGFILGQGASDDLLPGHFITRSRSKWVQFQPATF